MADFILLENFMKKLSFIPILFVLLFPSCKEGDNIIYVAQGTDYNEYSVQMGQWGTDNPQVTVVTNTLGGIPTVTRWAVGKYLVTLQNAFPRLKTVVKATNGQTYGNISGEAVSDHAVCIYSYDGQGNLSDGILTRANVEIRVHK
jgi:hypothetical protein